MEQKKILWIEDDADMLMGLVRPLENDGHEITVAKDEKEALERIEKFDFDLILLDMIIPTGVKGDVGDVPFVGMRLLKKLSIDMKLKTPIIVLSVVRDSEIISEMYGLGVEKVLPKGAYLPSKLKEEVYESLGCKGE
jgi:CheY-like chemotaxis protein